MYSFKLTPRLMLGGLHFWFSWKLFFWNTLISVGRSFVWSSVILCFAVLACDWRADRKCLRVASDHIVIARIHGELFKLHIRDTTLNMNPCFLLFPQKSRFYAPDFHSDHIWCCRSHATQRNAIQCNPPLWCWYCFGWYCCLLVLVQWLLLLCWCELLCFPVLLQAAVAVVETHISCESIFALFVLKAKSERENYFIFSPHQFIFLKVNIIWSKITKDHSLEDLVWVKKNYILQFWLMLVLCLLLWC